MSRCSLLKLFLGRFVLPSVAALTVIVPPAWSAQAPLELDPAEAQRLAPAEATPVPRGPITDPDTSYDPKESERFRVLRGGLRPEHRAADELRLRALEGFLDYDEEAQILYGPRRTRVEYGKFSLEADKLILDNRLQEVQAEGNVIMTTSEPDPEKGGKENVIHADSIRYNFAEGEGVAFKISGAYPPIYFATAEKKVKKPGASLTPDLQQVSKEESLFRNTSVTSCDFKVPHYHLKAREVILFRNDRVFFRGATLYVVDVPVFYLPFYSASLKEGSPWFFQFGVGERTGARMRVGYEYQHETREPSLKDDQVYEVRSRGQAQLFSDILTKRGLGLGFNYKYDFDFGRHTGEFQTYGIEDSERKVGESGASDNVKYKKEPERYQVLWRHRSQLTKDSYLQADVDWFSDPEIFYDILDEFTLRGPSKTGSANEPLPDGEFDRGRPIQRRGRIALTYLREAWVARILAERKDRIGIDRYGDFSNPSDNDNDFDLDPGTKLKDSKANSLANSRWGTVSERAPEITLASRYLPVRDWPLYWLAELHVYNNLDKGINVVSDSDDARVAGAEFYNQMLWQYAITQRYILLVKLGVGAGAAQRSSDDLGLTLSELNSDDALDLIDNDGTFKVGRKKYNLDDINPFYAWADTQIRLNARFSDALSGFLLWKFRETTQDFIGDFYAQVGDYTSRQDLYNYRLRENWIQGNLTYQLLYPALVAFANAGINLENRSNLFPNEEIGYWNIGSQWANHAETVKLRTSIGESWRQDFAPSDPRSGEQDSLTLRGDLDYKPIHGRWYSRVQMSRRIVKDSSATQDVNGDYTLFAEDDDRTQVGLVYGRELGPKWDTEIRLKWDSEVSGFREIAWLLQRDLHDAIAILRIRSRQDFEEADSRSDNVQTLDVGFGLKLKLPKAPNNFGSGDIRTVRDRQRPPVIAY